MKTDIFFVGLTQTNQ